MIDSQEISLMRELMDVQAARRANWPSPAGPADINLEQSHRGQITSIRDQLSACRESVPAPAAVVVEEPLRGTFFSRVLRRILPD